MTAPRHLRARRRIELTVAGAVVALVIGQGCTGAGGATESTAPVPTTTSAISAEPEPAPSEATTSAAASTATTVADAIDWTAPLIGGGEIDMRGFGDRAVMLWFWAPY